MKEFTTAATKTADEDEGVEVEWMEFKHDGEVWRYQQPSSTQFALLMAAFGRYGNDADKMAGIIDFFVGVLDPETHRKVVARLFDPTDKFGLKQVEDICKWMLDEDAGRPTDSRSGSTGSRPTTGQKSSQPTPA